MCQNCCCPYLVPPWWVTLGMPAPQHATTSPGTAPAPPSQAAPSPPPPPPPPPPTQTPQQSSGNGGGGLGGVVSGLLNTVAGPISGLLGLL